MLGAFIRFWSSYQHDLALFIAKKR